jgi:hypothetical protein
MRTVSSQILKITLIINMFANNQFPVKMMTKKVYTTNKKTTMIVIKNVKTKNLFNPNELKSKKLRALL